MCFLRGPCKVVIKKSSVEKNWVEFRDASLPRYKLGSRGIELSWQLQNNGKKGIRLWEKDFMCDLKWQWDLWHQIVTCRRCACLVDGFWIWWLHLLHLIHSRNSGLQALQRYRLSTNFTVHRYTHTTVLSLLSLVVSWQRIFKFHIKSHIESFFHRRIPFLPLFCRCQFQRLYSIQFQAHIPAGWRPEIWLFTANSCSAEHFIITNMHEPRTKHHLSIVGKVCLQLYYLVTDVQLLRALAPAGMSLPSRCLAMNLYVTITILMSISVIVMRPYYSFEIHTYSCFMISIQSLKEYD
jgi:hypothetical protein